MECFCFLRNVVDLLAWGKTAWKSKYGEDFDGPIIPFGAAIEYKPISDKDQARLHKLGCKVLPGIFLGYEQKAGGGWSGDLWVVDSEELETAEHVNKVYPKRLKAAEVLVTK